MGAEERSYARAYAGFATVRAGHGVYRKQILPPPGSTDGLAGSCSLKGTVTFKPTPATNTPQPLSSDYTATGTCTAGNPRVSRRSQSTTRRSLDSHESTYQLHTGGSSPLTVPAGEAEPQPLPSGDSIITP